MLSVGDGVTDNVLQENLEDTTSFFVNQARDTLHTTTTSETTDSLREQVTYEYATLSAKFSQNVRAL